MPDVRELTIREAIREALAEEMARNPMVFLMGEDIGRPGGIFMVTAGLQEQFGVDRVMDTPISEMATIGGAIGSRSCSAIS